MRKSQAIITDFFIALFVFLILITAIVYIWNDYNTKIVENVEYERMQLVAYQITNQMLKNKGVPSAWEKDSVNVGEIGLVVSDRKLSKDKVDAFVNLPYNAVRDILNIEGYDYSFKIKSLSNTILSSSGGIPGDTEVVSIERYGVYDGENVILQFKIWKEQ